jgi:hypothetical protein
VLIEEVAWLDNGIAVVHTGTGAVVVRGSTFSGGGNNALWHHSGAALFSFGGALSFLDTQFELVGSVASCRHISDCSLQVERSSVSSMVGGSFISMCSGSGLSLKDVSHLLHTPGLRTD